MWERGRIEESWKGLWRGNLSWGFVVLKKTVGYLSLLIVLRRTIALGEDEWRDWLDVSNRLTILRQEWRIAGVRELKSPGCGRRGKIHDCAPASLLYIYITMQADTYKQQFLFSFILSQKKDSVRKKVEKFLGGKQKEHNYYFSLKNISYCGFHPQSSK